MLQIPPNEETMQMNDPWVSQWSLLFFFLKDAVCTVLMAWNKNGTVTCNFEI